MHRHAAITASCVALCAILVALPARGEAADESSPPSASGPGKRPKICLVLSGGGARGAAHVGVLKVLEQYRVPIDCITGTSMGSLVGAAYASGMSVEEMETTLKGISTELLFKEKPPRQELSQRRKQDDYNIFFGPELGLREGSVQFGKGVVTGVQLESVLRQLSKVKGYHDFDNLPIPFRAVATDLVTGKAVVFRDGELANVMRASMSVPGAVAPAEFDGMILVDGMLTGNLPVEAAHAMGADIVIAVNVGTPLLKREQLTGILGVAGQMLSILTEQNVQTSLALLKPTDVLISPELGDFSTGDFDHLPQIAPLGEAAARKVGEQLAHLSLPPAEYAALRERQTITVTPDLRPVDEIRFVNLQRVNPWAAATVMETRVGQPIDQPTLDKDMRRLYGTDDFEHVNYRFLEEPGKRVLAVDAVEKSWGPDYLRFGLGLSSDFSGDAYFNLLASYRKTWMNSLGGEWRSDVQVGRTSSLQTEFYQPVDSRGYFFVAPHAAIERRSTTVYQDDNRVARYEATSTTAGADIGSHLFRYGELRVGLLGGVLKPKLDTGPQILSPGESKVSLGAYRVRLILDQIDSAHFPRTGWRSSAHVYGSRTGLGADVSYTKWDVDGSAAYSVGNHTFNFGFKVGGKSGSGDLPRYDLFQWGGFLQQSGYATGQLLGENIKFARLMYYHRVLPGTMLEGAYGGISFELGKVGNPLVVDNSDAVMRSAAVFIAADSPIGPAYLGYGRAQDGNSNFYFYLGRPF
ncbi:MAG: patatin-like phospholipase family protein [Azoarcus sp.]|nr:patatin-like phospholipase family protein [Azoarcus sp.]